MKHLIEYLKKYQAWRRGEDDCTMEEADIKPKELGEKLDEAIKWLELMSKHSDLAELKKLAARQVAYEDASDITDAIHEIAALRCYREDYMEVMGLLRTMYRERYDRDAEVVEKLIEKLTDADGGFSLKGREWLQGYADGLRQRAKDVE
jgi:hypothetical protein